MEKNQLVNRDLSRLLIKVYDICGDFEKVAAFLAKNESVAACLKYSEAKNCKFDLYGLILSRKIEITAQ